MKLQIHKGTTSKLVDVFVQDTSKTDGSGLTGLVFNTAGLTAYYYREGAGSAVAITLTTMTLGTWATGGFVAVDGTNLPGVYQLSLPDAACATGANSVVLMLKGAANMAPVLAEVQLTDTDVNDGVRFGLTALPNAAAGATGGLDCTIAFGGTASAGSATSITLAGGAAVDNYYNHQVVQITAGTGAGQARVISNYVGSTKVALVSRSWRTNPDNTSVFQVKGLDVIPTIGVLSGLAVAATGTTITLTSLAVATDNYYNGCLVVIGGGTGVTQTRVIKSYVGATQVATVDRAWATTPDTTSVFLVVQTSEPALDTSLQVAANAVNGSVTGSVASVAAGGITTASFAAGAIDSTIFAQSAANRVLTGATIAELSQGQPPVNPTLVQAVMLPYHALRNGRTITATTDSIQNDAGVVICKSAVSDDGSTFTRAKTVTGP